MMRSTTAQQPKEQVAYERAAIASLPMMSCAICDAGYVPTPAHEDLRHAPSAVLESALMSMCHFCFRCRRAACPACWDEVHGVCGSCTLEAHLPFRTEVRQLEGVMPAPVRQVDTLQEKTMPPMLVCVRPGRFQTELPGSISARQMMAVPSPVAVHASHGHARAEKPGDFMEQVVTMVLSVVLVAIVVLIVLAEVSAPANMVIVRVLHVDIRQEVAYLLYVVRQLH